MKKKTKVVNYVRNGVVVRSEVVPDVRPTKGWNDEEIQFLHDNHMTMSAREMSVALKRSWESVRGQMKRLKITVGESRRKQLQAGRKGLPTGVPGAFVWTPQNVQFIKDNHKTMMVAELAAAIGAKYLTVYRKLHSLGFGLDKERSMERNKEVIDQLNERKKAYFKSDEFRRKKQLRRIEKVKLRLQDREFREVKRLKKQLIDDNERVVKIDKRINKLANTKQELRADIKRKELRIKTLEEKLKIEIERAN